MRLLPGFEAAVFACCCSLIAAAAAAAQEAPSPTPTPAPSATPAPTRTPAAIKLPSAKTEVDRQRKADSTFMSRAQLRGLEEVELGTIAAQKAANTALRALARQIVDERGSANEALRLFAEGQGIELPAALDSARRAEVDRISRLAAPDLERACVQAMVRLQDADVADFQDQSRAAQEVELQAWVFDTLPLLEDERDQIHEVAEALGIPAPPAPR
jgi:putative membrane protein